MIKFTALYNYIYELYSYLIQSRFDTFILKLNDFFLQKLNISEMNLVKTLDLSVFLLVLIFNHLLVGKWHIVI